MKCFVLCRKANIAHRASPAREKSKNRQGAFSKSETTMSIRNILMSLSTGLAVLALSLSPAGPGGPRRRRAHGFARAGQKGRHAPDAGPGRASFQQSGLYRRAPLSAQELSNLPGPLLGRTARRPPHRAFDMNRQEVAVYVVRENGVWRYDAAGHALIRELSGDYRDAAGGGLRWCCSCRA